MIFKQQSFPIPSICLITLLATNSWINNLQVLSLKRTDYGRSVLIPKDLNLTRSWLKKLVMGSGYIAAFCGALWTSQNQEDRTVFEVSPCRVRRLNGLARPLWLSIAVTWKSVSVCEFVEHRIEMPSSLKRGSTVKPPHNDTQYNDILTSSDTAVSPTTFLP